MNVRSIDTYTAAHQCAFLNGALGLPNGEKFYHKIYKYTGLWALRDANANDDDDGDHVVRRQRQKPRRRWPRPQQRVAAS